MLDQQQVRRRWRARWAGVPAVRDDSGSAAVEFVLVGAMLTALTLAVLQFGLAVYVRNVVHDAAVEGAHYAALADTTLDEGAERTREVIARALPGHSGDDALVTLRETSSLGYPAVELTVRTTLPIAGMFGPRHAWEVSAHAPIESFD